MKKMFKNNYLLILTSVIVIGIVSCTKLDTKLKDPNSEAIQTAGGAPAASSLSQVYNQLNQIVGNGGIYAMSEHTTDELLGPTRGTDWDDFAVWRKLHLHTWDGSHGEINNAWNGLNGALFQTTLLAETSSGQTQAEAKFLRAYFSYIICDAFGQVQHRPATAAVQDLPDVFTRAQATDFIISELEAIIPALPAYTHANRNMANKAAAQFLLAKTYLNKAVFKQDPTKPAGPFTFDAADMNKVIALCNAIIASPALSVSSNYWDNFTWDNGTKSTENIFVRQNSQGINMVWASCMGNHYFMPPDGWNGFTTLADFYNSFEQSDVRRSQSIPGYTSTVGRPAGFLVGQQQGPKDKKVGNPIVDLKDRSGNPLVFTPDVSLFFSTESKGIRTNKYPLDPSEMNNGGWASQNEYVFFRLSDVLLMKAEAILRGGTDPQTALSIVNSIRTKRGVGNLTSVNLATLLAERGRELYLEAWRRNDMIRYGVFNEPVGERPQASDPSKVVFPIPNIALSSNPNLKQNFGY
ncbi:MAG: RagB/SusD domain protein [Chitinophagaceae bacterium]|nr:RagB/SusD domain protein [Chitinophagaceae bacterium]